jgi:cell division protease FtsH
VNKFGRNAFLWTVIVVSIIALFNLFQDKSNSLTSIPYSDFLQEVEQGKILRVDIKGQNIIMVNNQRLIAKTYAPYDPELIKKLAARGVQINVVPRDDEQFSFLHLILSWLPMLLLMGGWFFIWRQMQSGGNRALGFGKSKAKMLGEKVVKIKFDDVAGIDEAKNELGEIIDFLKDPKKFQRLGGKIPRGVLLVGPPGTGKTLLARAIAGEAGVPFFSISGSEFVEMFVGVGASRVRDMFEQGKRNAPCIIFVDEIDAVGRHRGFGLGGGNDEREQTLNQLLVEMDGFEDNAGVIIIAATNRPDVLDPALLRPGRFDRQVVVPNPDLNGRERILKVHSKKVPLSSDVDLMVIARGTPGFSGADLANLVNEAALLAARRGKRQVSMSEFESAKDKVLMGIERRSMVMSDEEKRLTAYHEAGHAIVALNMKDSDPIHKATIIPRGRALGMVMRLPESDRISVSRDKLEADLCVAMGGRIAEELVFGYGKVTTGASSDIKQATDIVKKMIIEWGMGKLGFLSYAESSQDVFLGHSMVNSRQMSEVTAQAVDREVRELVDRLYEKTYDLLSNNMEQLHVVAKGLIDYETLSGDEIKALLRGETINRQIPTTHEVSKAKDSSKSLDFPTSKKTYKKAPAKQSKTSASPFKRKADNRPRSAKSRSSKQKQ